MLFSKKKGLTIDTLIGEGTAIDGDLVFSGGLRLDGKVRGNIRAAGGKPSMLVISEKGMVEGEIAVGHLFGINNREPERLAIGEGGDGSDLRDQACGMPLEFCGVIGAGEFAGETSGSIDHR